MAYKTILLDLDGTLTDSKEGIYNCLRHAFTQMGISCPDETVLRRFIGPPLPDSLVRYCGMNEAQIDQAMELFRQRYTAVGKFENTPADGMLDLCQHLHEKGYQLALASSKPEMMCRDICEKFGFAAYLDVVAGAPLSEHSTKADVIMDALSRLGVQGNCLDTVLMVGDRKFDVLGAKECGICSVGVEFFGYADENELQEAGALAIFDTAEALEQWTLEH